MKGFRIIWLGIAVVSILMGCTGDTSVSRTPGQDEIQAGINRRLAAIDKMNIPEAAKERMRQQARGQVPTHNTERTEGLKNNSKK
jgi:hypothetical protein